MTIVACDRPRLVLGGRVVMPCEFARILSGSRKIAIYDEIPGT